jgi:hypothetical protein
LKGTGFSPYINPARYTRALAPEGSFFKLTHYQERMGGRRGSPELSILRVGARKKKMPAAMLAAREVIELYEIAL